MKIYTVSIPLKVTVKCLDYGDSVTQTSKEENIELDLHIRKCSSHEDAVEEVKRVLEELIQDEMNIGLVRNEE
jgi:hypothetical protein